MCVIGNPPYSVHSSNKGEWIKELIKDYKKDLNEKKLNLDDDYIKFIRYGQHFIEKNGEGILAYISNNSFIDGVTHRQMRKNLLETFDKIYVLNLHGNSNQRETTPDGNKDENVFDIMQGVSINIFVKTRCKKNSYLADVFQCDLYGMRAEKYTALWDNDISSLGWKKIEYKEPYFFFLQKDFKVEKKYSKAFKVSEFFEIYNSGVKTDRDALFIDQKKESLAPRIETLLSGEIDSSFVEKYRVKDSGSYKITSAIIGKNYNQKYISKILYRPFDFQWIYYEIGRASCRERV